MWTLFLLVGCSGGDDGVSSPTDPSSTDTVRTSIATGSTASTGETGTLPTSDTGSGDTGLGDTGLGETGLGETGLGETGPSDTGTTPPVVCMPAPLPVALPSVPTTWTPLAFAPRADGLTWFGLRQGIYEGVDVASSTLVHASDDVQALAALGDTVWWLDFARTPALWRAEGALPAVQLAALPDGVGLYYPFDLELHASGSAALLYFAPASFGSTPYSQLAWVSPAGVLHTTGVSGLSVPADVFSITYRADGLGLWATTPDTLRAYAVDVEGRPDWSQIDLEVPLPSGVSPIDLVADACDRLYFIVQGGYIGYANEVGQFDPDTGVYVPLGTVDHGYGSSPLRFGKAPGEKTILRTMSGGWTSNDYDWLSWDVGVPGP